jgi:hypothetical protein
MESGGQGEIGGCGEISTKKSVTWTFGFNLWIGSKWSINMALPKNMEFGMAQYCLLLMIKHFFSAHFDDTRSNIQQVTMGQLGASSG